MPLPYTAFGYTNKNYINLGYITIEKIELSAFIGHRIVGYAINVHTQPLGMLAVIQIFCTQQLGTLAVKYILHTQLLGTLTMLGLFDTQYGDIKPGLVFMKNLILSLKLKLILSLKHRLNHT